MYDWKAFITFLKVATIGQKSSLLAVKRAQIAALHMEMLSEKADCKKATI